MALIDHIDPINRRIYLSTETIDASIHPIDLYKEMRTLRRLDDSLRAFDVFLKGEGNIPKGGGKYTERYVVCLQGTKIVPYNVSHVLTITGTILTDDEYEGVYCFDRSLLSASTVVDINYVPPQVEVITVSTGSGLSTEESTQLASLNPAIQDVKVDTELIAAIESGRWLIQNNQQIFYKPDNVTEIVRFDLRDNNGLPSETEVYERIKV